MNHILFVILFNRDLWPGRAKVATEPWYPNFSFYDTIIGLYSPRKKEYFNKDFSGLVWAHLSNHLPSQTLLRK